MDAIFGRENYRNEITWERMQGSKNSARNWGRSSDTILYYVKGEAPPIWNTQYRALSASGRGNYRHDDGDGRGLYRIGDVGAPGNGGYFYDLGLGEVTPKRGYRMPETSARKMLAAGELWIKPGRVPGRKRYLSASKGTAHSNMWYDEDVKGISGPKHPEDTGYPTQKPLALYERIIAASSNPGDVVLDPFCGCATTPIAAERLGRQWIGMDLWDKAHKTVLERLEQEGLAVPDGGKADGQARMITFGKVRYETEPPERTDGGEVAAPFLQVTERYDIPADGSPRTRAAMLEHLLTQHGPRCQGCDREFDDPRYLQLDHNTPHKDGGINHISNRILLCGPCNREKGARYTLTGLRERNAKMGYMRGARG